MPVSPARAAAFDILLRVEQEDAYASELLHSAQYRKLSPADHGLATELVMGVLRWRSLLDVEISKFSSQKLEKLDAEVLIALRLAAYQLLWLDRIPARAAVHESVEIVKRVRKRSAVPFVNALLRKISDHTEWAQNLRKDLDGLNEALEADPSIPRSTVVAAPQRPSTEFIRYLADRYAHPLWLVELWFNQYGLEAVRRILHYDQEVPATSIVLPEPPIEAAFEKTGVVLLNGELLRSAARVESGDVTRTTAFREGRVFIQDEASQLVALLVGNGSNILDCCAAPGGKTRVLAARNPEASILAVDLHPRRARLLRKLVPAKNVNVVAADVFELPVSARFDRVLADVPCSGTGTLSRNPEIKWRLKPKDLVDLQTRQVQILRSAMRQTAPGGRLVYSTCSLEWEENAAVVDRMLAEDNSFRVFDCRVELERLRSEGELVWKDIESLASGPYLRTIPGVHPCDGFFAAILEKN
jgi:16S rRNA (cytosine967-C5)-methyltransferase